MANKSKNKTDKTEIADAEIVEETSVSPEPEADSGEKPLATTDSAEDEKPAEAKIDPVDEGVETPDEPADEPVSEDESVVDTEQHEDGTSLSTRALQMLALIFVGIGLALWGAPKLAPMLPQGLAPVAEFLMPGQTEAKAEVAALRSEIETQIAAIEAAPKDTVTQEAIDKAIAAYDASKTEELALIKDKLAATDGQEIEARIAALETQLQGVTAELKAVSERLSMQITENGAALSEEAAAKLSGYQAVLEGLKAQVKDLAAKNGALSQKVEEAAAASSRRIQEAEQNASSKVADTTTKKLLTEISAALDSGSPFKPALEGLVQTAKIEAPAALSAVAETGTPSWTSLRNSYAELAHAALRADTAANAGDGIMGKFGAFLKTQVGTRSLERKEGTSTDAILSRVEDDLNNRRLSAALKEAQTLPNEPRSAMADWIANLASLSAAQSALNELNTALGAT